LTYFILKVQKEVTMSNVGQRERATQDRVINFFQKELGYDYLGNWEERDGNRNLEPEYLRKWL
jgi:type I restriction enzyme R subunit